MRQESKREWLAKNKDRAVVKGMARGKGYLRVFWRGYLEKEVVLDAREKRRIDLVEDRLIKGIMD